MKKVYIVAAKRTAIGKFMGSLSPFNPGELGALVIKEIIKESGISPGNIDSVIAGNILSAGQLQGVARQAAVKGGVPVEIPAYSLNMVLLFYQLMTKFMLHKPKSLNILLKKKIVLLLMDVQTIF